MVKLVQHHLNISNPMIDKLKGGAILNPSSQSKYQKYCKSNSYALVLLRIDIFQRLFLPMVLLTTNYFSVFGYLNSFLLLKAKYQTHLADKPKFKRHPHRDKAFISPKHIYKNVVEQYGILTSLGAKLNI